MFEVGDTIKRVRNPEDYTGPLELGDLVVVTKVGDKGQWLRVLRNGLSIPGEHSSMNFGPHYKPATAAVVKRRALPTDSDKRKRYPMFSGLLAYFPAALAEVSNHSFEGNEKHNPGLPLQHARGKSGDHEDCIIRHLVDAREQDRTAELRAAAWRILALLQEHLESEGAPAAPAATFNHKDA